jgi:hypothetical protein
LSLITHRGSFPKTFWKRHQVKIWVNKQPFRREAAPAIKGAVMQPSFSRRLVNDIVAAKILCQSPITLRKWRISGNAPKFVKLGQCVRYDVDDLAAFIEGRKSSSTAEAERLPGAKRRPAPGTVGRPKKPRPADCARTLEAV